MNTRYISWRDGGKRQFSTVIAGDFCPREQNCADLVERVDEITTQVKPFFDSADLKFLQWECTVTNQDTPIDKSGPNHRCYPECTVFATALGIDTVLLANNHTGDYGVPGVKDTLDAFAKLNIRTVGAGMNAVDAARPLRIQQNGLTVSVINAAEYEFGIAYGDVPGAYGIDPLQIALDVKREKAECDLVIVTLHGGHEQNPLPSPRMTQAFRYFATCGADIVFNCHTHCIGGVEFVGKVPVVYSPGNFFFTRVDEPPTDLEADKVWRTGYMPKFHFDKDGVYAFEIIPYYFSQSEIMLLEGEREEKFFNYLNKLNAIIADDEAVARYFDGWSYARGYKGYLNAIIRGIPSTIPNIKVKEEIAPFLGTRNIFTCESHNDMIKNTMRLIEEGRLEEVAPIYEEMKELMVLDF